MPRKHRISVSGILRHLGVSRSGYCAWLNRRPSPMRCRKMELKEEIQQIHEESHQIYGAPKIAKELQKKGESITVKTVGNYIRQMGLRAHWVKPYIQTTVDSDYHESLKNILDEQFNPAEPNAVWVSYITYIWTFEGFVYLTSIMDLFSRKIISWVPSRTMEAVHVVKAVEKAKKIRVT